MTFSIIARCPRSGAFGIAAATGMPGVGKLLTHARADIGAVATQGLLNPYLGLDGLEALARSARHTPDSSRQTADEILTALMGNDADRQRRQVAMIDARGDTAVWTGSQCLPWAGSRQGDGFSIQGNLLADGGVLDACQDAFVAAYGADLALRLLLTLEAGEAAGGDRRGTQSATIYVMDTEEYPLWDVRIDHHAAPMAELRRVYDEFEANLVPHIRAMPKRHSDLNNHDADCGLSDQSPC